MRTYVVVGAPTCPLTDDITAISTRVYLSFPSQTVVVLNASEMAASCRAGNHLMIDAHFEYSLGFTCPSYARGAGRVLMVWALKGPASEAAHVPCCKQELQKQYYYI
jgi:hypothetical protein